MWSPLCSLLLKRLHTTFPHQSSTMALAKRANGKWTVGAPAALSAHVLFMSRGRCDAPRHTPCQKHTLPYAQKPLTTLFLQTSLWPLKLLWHFHFMCCFAVILPSKEVIIVRVSCIGRKTLSWNVSAQLTASHRCFVSGCVNVII